MNNLNTKNTPKLTSISGDINTTLNTYEDIKQKVKSADTLVRDLHIQNLEFKEVLTKKGYSMGMVCFEYLNPIYDDAEWKQRRVPARKDEAQVIVEAGPYEGENTLYRVTAVKKNGFYEWTCIKPIDTTDSNSGVST